MPKTTQITESGPILGALPQPPYARTRLLLVERLQGHTTSPSWLPEGIWPELDELRGEQLRHRRQVVEVLDARNALLAAHAAEDKGYTEALREAARAGATPPEDARTAAEQHDREVAALDERLWAAVDVFAEHADRVIEFIREHEDAWLAELRSRLAPAQEKRRQAAALLAQAQSEEFRLHKLGRWLMSTADDQGFARQPAPNLEQPPERLSRDVFQDSLERPWHQKREWSGAKPRAAA